MHGGASKQIPTLLGIGILIISLIAGVLLIGQGGGIFAPRASPQTTPKKIHVTNVKDISFTVSFLTDEHTAGFIKYGTAPNTLTSRAGDDRDQSSGSVGEFASHYITVRDASPDTTYYFTLGTGTSSKFDNNGKPYIVHTGKKLGNLPGARTVYGSVNNADNTPAVGAIVYLSTDNMSELSSLVKDSSGSTNPINWTIPVSTARTLDGSQYFPVTDNTSFILTVQGTAVAMGAQQQILAANAQPVPPIILSGSGVQVANNVASGSAGVNTVIPTPFTTQPPVANSSIPPYIGPAVQVPTAAFPPPSPLLSTILNQPPVQAQPVLPSINPNAEVDMTTKTKKTINTTQPQIVGQAASGIVVTVTIHSTNPVTTQVQTDANGNYVVDLAALEKSLAPGTHTVTVSYTDPITGKLVTQTKTFVVAKTATPAPTASPSPSPSFDPNAMTNTSAATPPNTALADSSTSNANNGPYGTSNPYPVDTTSPSPTISTKVSVATTSGTLPKTGTVSTTIFLILAGLFLIITGAGSYVFATRTVKQSLQSDHIY